MKVRHFVEATFLEMLKQKPIGQIHVADIIEAVGICKGTFYKYYCDKYDLLQKCFENEYYREILEHSETFEQFVEYSLNAFRKTPKTVLHAMSPEDADSLYAYHTRLVREFLLRDGLRSEKDAENPLFARVIMLYAENVTRLTVEWLSTSRHGQTEEAMGLIRAAQPVALSD